MNVGFDFVTTLSMSSGQTANITLEVFSIDSEGNENLLGSSEPTTIPYDGYSNIAMSLTSLDIGTAMSGGKMIIKMSSDVDTVSQTLQLQENTRFQLILEEKE